MAIKRGDLFFPISAVVTTDDGFNRFVMQRTFHEEQEIYVVDNTFEIMHMMPGDCLVVTGYHAHQFHFFSEPLAHVAFEIFEKSPDGFSISSHGGGAGWGFTYINGIEIADFPQLDDYMFLLNWPSTIFYFTGNMGQHFTLGKWEGTNWEEVELTVDSTVHRVENEIEFSIETTLDGYFYFNLYELESRQGLILVQVDGLGFRPATFRIG